MVTNLGNTVSGLVHSCPGIQVHVHVSLGNEWLIWICRAVSKPSLTCWSTMIHLQLWIKRSVRLTMIKPIFGNSWFRHGLFFHLLIGFCVTRPKLPLGQMLNHATYHVYSLKAVGVLICGKCYGYCFL